VLDGLAAGLATQRDDERSLQEIEKHLQRMEKCVRTQNANDWFIHHVAFHESIMQASGNNRLLGLISNVRLSIQRFHPVLLTTPDRLRTAFQEHLDIFKAIKRRDPKTAEALARVHIANAREIVVRLSVSPNQTSERVTDSRKR